MKRPDPTLQALDALREATTPQALKPFFKNRSAIVLARAATHAAELGVEDLIPDLTAAYRHIVKDGVKHDRGATAQLAIATALVQHDAPAAEIYGIGVRREQWDPVWNGQVDVAAPVRALCAIGLVRINHPDALFEAATLLADREREARVGAIRALAESGRSEAELLLRYKARIGDEEPSVTEECFAALLRLAPKSRSLPYVAEFLRAEPVETANAAAIALGQSRITEAFPILTGALEAMPDPERRGALLWGIALLRQEAALEFLFELLESSPEPRAAAVLEALSVYKNDEAVRARAAKVIASRGPLLGKTWRQRWEGD